MKPTTPHTAAVPLREPLFRGARRLRIALVGLPNSGKSTFFAAVASTSVQSGALAGTRRAYNECTVQIGLDEARVIDLPSIRSPHHLESEDRAALKYLLWGDERPPVSRHEPEGPSAPFAPPDVIVQVLDATLLEHHLELTLKLVKLGRPLVIALNKMDEAEERGICVNGRALSARLGVAVVPTTAIMGHGTAELFRAAVHAVREGRLSACATAKRAHHDRARAARVVVERARGSAGLPCTAAIARVADRGGRSVFSRRNAPALSRIFAGGGATAREGRKGAAASID
jgi:Fe2+ transport system protein B